VIAASESDAAVDDGTSKRIRAFVVEPGLYARFREGELVVRDDHAAPPPRARDRAAAFDAFALSRAVIRFQLAAPAKPLRAYVAG